LGRARFAADRECSANSRGGTKPAPAGSKSMMRWPLVEATFLAALSTTSCWNDDILPPVQQRVPAIPSATAVPLPDLECISQMGVRRPQTQPRLLHHVSPAFPERQAPTRFSGTMWVGEARVGRDGRVVEVKVVRAIRPDPPWPEWEQAIPDAIRRWQYEPLCVDGRTVEWTVTVATSVNFFSRE